MKIQHTTKKIGMATIFQMMIFLSNIFLYPHKKTPPPAEVHYQVYLGDPATEQRGQGDSGLGR